MPKEIDIDWDKARAAYVMRPDNPSLDTLAEEFHVSKGKIAAVSVDRKHPVNRGKSWQEQRNSFIQVKQSEEEKAVVNATSKIMENFIKGIGNIGISSYNILEKKLNWILDEVDRDPSFNISKHIRISDFLRIVELLHNINSGNNGGNGAKTIALHFNQNLSDITTEQLKKAVSIVKGQSPMPDDGVVDAEYSIVGEDN